MNLSCKHLSSIARVCTLILGLLPASGSFAQESDGARVLDEAGRPLEGVKVHFQTRPFFPILDEVQNTSETLTDKDGKFVLNGVPPAEALIVVSKDGFVTRGFSAGAPLPEEIELIPGNKLVGGVVNDKGVSVSQAMIGPAQLSGRNELGSHKTQPLLFTKSDENGMFELNGFPNGRYDVLVQGTGVSARLVPMVTGQYKKVMLATGGTTVTGIVTGSRDKAIKRRVYVEASAPGIKLYTVTDRQGRYTFPHLGDREWQFKVINPTDSVRHPAQTIELVTQFEPYELNLLMSQGIKVGGSVFNIETSAPLADMELMLDMEPRRETKTDAAGKFVFENVELFADPVIRFDATKYTYETPAGEVREYVEIPFTEESELTTLTLGLRPRCLITGSVVDKWKRPVPNAVVTARSATGAQRREGKNMQDIKYNVKSRNDGTFRLLVTPAGGYEVSAVHDQMISDAKVVETYSTASAELSLEINPSGTVSGTVTDSDGKPVVGAAIDLLVAGDPDGSNPDAVGTGKIIQSVSSAERGWFEITGFAQKKVDLVASHPSYGSKATTTVDLSGATSTGITLQFPPGKDFVGTVTRPDGGIVPGAEVRVFYLYGGQQKSTTAESDSKGKVTFRAIPAEKLERVLVRNPLYVDYDVPAVPLPQTDYPIQMKARCRVVATITEVPPPADDSHPLNAMLLQASTGGEGANAPPADRYTVVDQKSVTAGKVTFEQLNPGWYKVAAKRGTLYAESEPSRLDETGTPTPFTVTVKSGGSVVGRVLDKTAGTQVAEAVVTLSPATVLPDVEKMTVLTGANGSFTLPNVPVGSMILSVTHPGYPDHSQELQITGQGNTDITIQLSSEMAKLKGTVKSQQGSPMSHVLLVLHKASQGENPIAASESDDQGAYIFEAIPPGRYILTAEGAASEQEQLRNKQFEVTVAAPETTKDIVFESMTKVAGKVKIQGVTRVPEGHTLMFIPKEGGSNAMISVKAGGSFEGHLEPGKYTVGLDDNPGQEVVVPTSTTPFNLDLTF